MPREVDDYEHDDDTQQNCDGGGTTKPHQILNEENAANMRCQLLQGGGRDCNLLVRPRRRSERVLRRLKCLLTSEANANRGQGTRGWHHLHAGGPKTGNFKSNIAGVSQVNVGEVISE